MAMSRTSVGCTARDRKQAQHTDRHVGIVGPLVESAGELAEFLSDEGPRDDGRG